MFFNSVTNNPAIAVLASGSQLIDRALETIKDVRAAVDIDFETLVVVVTANFTLSHTQSIRAPGSYAWEKRVIGI